MNKTFVKVNNSGDIVGIVETNLPEAMESVCIDVTHDKAVSDLKHKLTKFQHKNGKLVDTKKICVQEQLPESYVDKKIKELEERIKKLENKK